MRGDLWTFGLAGAFAVLALVTLGAWIPSDIESGIVETHRRRTAVGDAMAPTAAAAGMLVSAVLLGCLEFLRPRAKSTMLDRSTAAFVARMAVPVCAGLILMVHTGPLAVDAVNALGGDVGSYRVLRDTAPWKYLGYLVGGPVMIGGAIAVVERRFSKTAAATAVGATVLLMLLYDLPFDDLLLPPNGDQ